jgi:hypothetical protein
MVDRLSIPKLEDTSLSIRDKAFVKKIADVVSTEDPEVGTDFSNTDTTEMLYTYGFNE